MPPAAGAEAFSACPRMRAMGVLPEGRGEEFADVHDAIDKVVFQLMYNKKFQAAHVTQLAPSWRLSLFSLGGRAPLGGPYVLINVWAAAVVVLLERFAGLEPTSTVTEAPWTNLRPLPLILCSVGLMFLVVFRTQTSYAKWVQARTAWVNINSASRDLASQCCTLVKDFDATSAMCRYVVIFVISVRFWLRSEDLDEEFLSPILTQRGFQYLHGPRPPPEFQQKVDNDDTLPYQFKQVCKPLPVLEVLRGIIAGIVANGQMGPFHPMMEGNLKILAQSLATMERVLDTQIPFAYITHVRTTVICYSMAIPFFLAKEMGWFTVLFVAFYCYVVMGLENLAVELENPFGTDANDLPMDKYCCQIARNVSEALVRRQEAMRRMQ